LFWSCNHDRHIALALVAQQLTDLSYCRTTIELRRYVAFKHNNRISLCLNAREGILYAPRVETHNTISVCSRNVHSFIGALMMMVNASFGLINRTLLTAKQIASERIPST
jgi:hypothetical protein